MKTVLTLLIMLSPLFMYSQNTLSMEDVTERQELSMSDAIGKSSDGVYRYYAKGSNVPYTGILFANHPNGNLNSWQNYIDGVGQGEWINYYENGNVKEIGNYDQNLVQGPIKKFHPNGIIKAEGTYKDWRIMIGEWKYYDDEGKLLSVVDYGVKGNIEEVEAYYNRGDIPYSWYSQILSKNGFEIK